MKKFTILTLLFIIIISILLIYFQNSRSNITSSTVKITGMVVEDQKTENTEPINEKEKEIIVEEEKPVEKIEETKFPETFLTDAKCIDGKEIDFTLNNILKKNIETSKLTFYAAGKTIRNPVCDKQSLNPNESTNCKLTLNFKFNKIIQFTIAYPAKSQSVNIDCGK